MKIVMDPCRCVECTPGPGLSYIRKRTLSDAMKEMGADNVEKRYCHDCRAVVWVISTDMGEYWKCTCEPHGHGWTVVGIT